MENEVKQRNQRNRRRERAQRMQAQRESKVKDGDSGEDESPAREKPPRPPARRKKSREPLGEEDIIDGFAIMAFRTYEDLEAAVKCASSPRTNALSNKPRLPLAALAGDPTRNHPPNNVNSHAITLLQDAGTSDDSGRASERLTGSSVAPRDPDSSRDRLSDCDSEGDDEKASPDNSRNPSPRYHDASMEDVSDAGALFRVTGAGGGGGGKNELVARGGSGGALALSRAPVGGSASPAPAPLPQPAPSPAPAALPPPAPAALPPPALPAPTFRADTHTPHRPKGAHIPAIDAHAATQIPTRGPDTPERPAPNNKLPPGARAAADSPTPAPPAPPAPSPLFPSHAAYQPHPAAALPDYRHTNHETRTEPPQQAAPPPAPLDLHAQHAPRPPAPAAPPPRVSAPSAIPAALPHRLPVSAPHSQPSSIPPCLPSQAVSGRPQSPAALVSRPYPAPTIGSSHTNSSVSSSIHNHAIPYQNQPSIQKHSVQSVYANRPPHLAPFGIPNHVSANHLPPPATSHTNSALPMHPMNVHSMASHPSHLPPGGPTSTVSHTAPAPISTATTTMSNYPASMKHPGLSMASHGPLVSAPVSLASMQHVDGSLLPTGTAGAASSVSSGALTASSELATSLPGSGYPPPAVFSPGAYPPLYAPYATTLQHSPYLPPAAASPRNTADARTSLSASPLVAPKTPKGVRPHTPGSTGAAGSVHAPHYSPRTQSPSRERDFSISSLSRSTPASVAVSSASAPSMAPAMSAPLTAPHAPPLVVPMSGPLSSGLTAPLATPTPTQAPTPSSHLTHSLAPVPTIPSISSSAKPPAHWGVTRPTGSERGAGFAPPIFSAPLPPPNPNPFSAESLFQTSPSADLLRRELDNRFLAAATRTELHHHQHQHTHVHQHPTHHPHHPHHLLFKDMSKMPSLYRTGLGLGYPYSSGLLPPPAPYVPPPAPLPSYAPKPVVSAASESASKPPPRSAVTKTGKWNAMHVRIAWEIYNHQQKEKSNGGVAPSGLPGDKDKLRAFPSPAPPPPAAYRSPYELSAPYLHPSPLAGVRAGAYPPAMPPGDRSLRVAGVSPFARYGAGGFPPTQPFPLAAYGRELALAAPLHPPPLLHDAWRMRPAAPPPGVPPVSAAGDQMRRDLEERERARREREAREDRERREREERERRRQRDREMERARTRSPLRNGAPDPTKEERKEAPRPPPSLPPYPPPPWDPYRTFDPLQHMRFAPLVEAAIRAEEDRAKMLSAYAHHQQLKSSALLRPLPPMHAPMAPMAPPLAPLAPLDLLKKEEPR